MAKNNKEKTDMPDVNIISGIALDRESVKLRSLTSKIIHSGEINPAASKIQIIGGDTDDANQESPPSIIIEKENDQISKIIVKCPCGRHAELLCEYEENT
ncbi:MAG: hypothetical protein A2017_09770 [Lentisphaerae bacterium GWF2_44_16]|nr:MAG: hypothetical protein A2017_09770 [Lentisphaerae bacterium GWF2_44_16]